MFVRGNLYASRKSCFSQAVSSSIAVIMAVELIRRDKRLAIIVATEMENGVATLIHGLVSISCCVAVIYLGSARVSCDRIYFTNLCISDIKLYFQFTSAGL